MPKSNTHDLAPQWELCGSGECRRNAKLAEGVHAGDHAEGVLMQRATDSKNISRMMLVEMCRQSVRNCPVAAFCRPHDSARDINIPLDRRCATTTTSLKMPLSVSARWPTQWAAVDSKRIVEVPRTLTGGMWPSGSHLSCGKAFKRTWCLHIPTSEPNTKQCINPCGLDVND